MEALAAVKEAWGPVKASLWVGVALLIFLILAALASVGSR